MKKLIASLCLCFLASWSSQRGVVEERDLQDRIDAAKTVLDQIMQAKDSTIPLNILQQATCVGVVPGMIKGAFVFGAQYGQGVVTCRTGHGWSAPVFIRMAGGSWGFQIGGQSTDLILVAVNDRGFQDLLKNKFKIGADASAAAGPVGRAGQAATDWKMNAELLSYSRNKGLFAGISLDGTSVSQNKDDTEIFYGAPQNFQNVLKGNVGVPPGASSSFARGALLLTRRSADQATATLLTRGAACSTGRPLVFGGLQSTTPNRPRPKCPKLVFASNDAADPRILAGSRGGARTRIDAALAGTPACGGPGLGRLSLHGPSAARGRAESYSRIARSATPNQRKEFCARSIVTSAGSSSSSAACPTTHARTRSDWIRTDGLEHYLAAEALGQRSAGAHRAPRCMGAFELLPLADGPSDGHGHPTSRQSHVSMNSSTASVVCTATAFCTKTTSRAAC